MIRKPGFAAVVAQRLRPDVVNQRGGTVDRRAGHGDLELARQERELGMQRRPLPDQLAPGPRIDDLVGRDAGERVARGVAHAVAARLDRVHVDGGELGEDFGHVLESRPVELQVLPRGEMPVTSVIPAGDLRQHPQLPR